MLFISFFSNSSCLIWSFWNAEPLVFSMSRVLSSDNFSLGHTLARSSTFLVQVSTSSVLGSKDGTSAVRFEGTKTGISCRRLRGSTFHHAVVDKPLLTRHFPWNRARRSKIGALGSATNVKLIVHPLHFPKQRSPIARPSTLFPLDHTRALGQRWPLKKMQAGHCKYHRCWYPDQLGN